MEEGSQEGRQARYGRGKEDHNAEGTGDQGPTGQARRPPRHAHRHLLRGKRAARTVGSVREVADWARDAQIIAWLHPLDLLHIARASKHFRGMLMSRHNS